MSHHNLKSHDDDDPYSNLLHDQDLKLKSPEKESSRARKWRVLKQKLMESSMNFQNGFLMGAMVGGSFGTIIGLYTALQTRSILMLPLSAIVSAASFGFFLGIGSMIRSEEHGFSEGVWRVEGGRLVRGEEIWKERMKME